MDSEMHGTASVHVDAPPDQVWSLVSDVTRMGEWSPETYEAAWVDGATGPAVGARFKGRNKQGWVKWSSTCTVTASEPGKEFAFVVGTPAKPVTRWRYEFTPMAGGTDVTETWESVHYGFFVKLFASPAKRTEKLDNDIAETLHKLKAAAEAASRHDLPPDPAQPPQR